MLTFWVTNLGTGSENSIFSISHTHSIFMYIYISTYAHTGHDLFADQAISHESTRQTNDIFLQIESEESFVRAEGDFRLALLFFPLLVTGSDQLHVSGYSSLKKTLKNFPLTCRIKDVMSRILAFSTFSGLVTCYQLSCACHLWLLDAAKSGDAAAFQILPRTATSSSLDRLRVRLLYHRKSGMYP